MRRSGSLEEIITPLPVGKRISTPPSHSGETDPVPLIQSLSPQPPYLPTAYVLSRTATEAISSKRIILVRRVFTDTPSSSTLTVILRSAPMRHAATTTVVTTASPTASVSFPRSTIPAKLATAMVKDSVESYINRDVALARSLDARDDRVDELFETVKRDLVALIRLDGANADQAILFMMIAKYLERIGDHAVNIGEWVEYAATGYHKMG